MKQYINLHIKINEENYEFFYAHLIDFPFTGIEERLDEIVISIGLEDWNDENKSHLNNAFEQLDHCAELIKEEVINEKNWNEEWESHIEPIYVDKKLVITPSWKLDEVDAELKLIINPKMSFGTGHHATTRLCCKLMTEIVKKGTFWVDAGTGTGVLAILASKLGASKCFAFDNNIWSIENAIENFDLNGVKDKIEIDELDIDVTPIPECDGIAANLFIHLVKRSMVKFYDALKKSKGDLIISGIMEYDKNDVLKEADNAGFKLLQLIQEDEWVAFHFGFGE